jgi:hypothetical protein
VADSERVDGKTSRKESGAKVGRVILAFADAGVKAGGGPPRYFLDVRAIKDLKSFVLEVRETKGLEAAFPGSAGSKGLTDENC